MDRSVKGQFVHFLVPAGTEIDSPLVALAMEHAARHAGHSLGAPYFANNEPGAVQLHVYADLLDG